jgi:hypothetical protein
MGRYCSSLAGKNVETIKVVAEPYVHYVLFKAGSSSREKAATATAHAERAAA